MKTNITQKALLKQAGAIIGYIIGLICGLTAVFSRTDCISIQIRWVYLISFVLISAIVISILYIRRYNDALEEGTIYYVGGYHEIDGKDIIFTKYTNSLRIHSVVTIYYNDSYDKILCYGIVYDVIPKVRIDIRILKMNCDENSHLIESLRNNNKALIETMYILPVLSSEKIKEIAKLL